MSLDRLLEKVYELPSIPKVVQELIASFSSQVADASSISRNIHADPVIAAKVLRLANSARYGAGRNIASLDTAVVMLGFDTLKTLVVASGVTGVMASIPGLDMKSFWRESFMVANLSKVVAKATKEIDPEIAFTCGMLHKIGVALMYLGHTEEMKQFEQSLTPQDNRAELEHDRFGYTNTEVSANLARIWRIPPIIQDALLNQLAPLAVDPPSHYAAVVKLAVCLNKGLEQQAENEQIIADLPESLVETLHVDTFKLFDQLKQMREAEDDIDSLLAA